MSNSRSAPHPASHPAPSPASQPTSPDAQALAALGALANAHRLAMVRALVAAGPQGLPASALAAAVGASPSKASFHLAALAEAGLVTAERAARQITYRVSYRAMGALLRYLMEDCCANDPTVRACCGGTAPPAAPAPGA